MSIEIDLPIETPLEDIKRIAETARVAISESFVSNTIRTIKISATSPEQLYNFGYLLGCETTKKDLSKSS